jgi:uncharacterized protein (TIGR03545 family)
MVTDKNPFTPRWSAVIPTGILVVTGILATFFFLDGAVKRAVEKAGTTLNGAQVNLNKASVSLLRLSATLHGLQVTDADAPMTNSIEIDRLVFHLEPKPLFWKKIIIHDASLHGIRTNTPRRVSGALPVKAQKEPEKPGLTQKAVSFAWGNLKEQYDPKKIVQLENLASYRKIQEEKTRLESLGKTGEARLDTINAEGLAQDIRAFSNRAKEEKISSLDDFKKAKDLLKDGKNLKERVGEAQKTLGDVQGALKTEMGQAKQSLEEIKYLKKQDVDGFVRQLKTSFSAEGLTRGLIGPQWTKKIQQALNTLGKIRSLLPQKEDEEKSPPPTRLGRTIPFPFHRSWPTFHLKKAALDGTTGGYDPRGDGPVQYRGVLSHLSSAPSLVGEPMGLTLSGAQERGTKKLDLIVELDYREKIHGEKVLFTYKGIPLANTDLGKIEAPLTIQSGLGAMTVDIKTRAGDVTGALAFSADPATLAYSLTPEQRKNKLLNTLQNIFSPLKRLDVTVHLSGALMSPTLKIESSVDNEIKSGVKQALQKELAEVEADIRARIDTLVDREKKKLGDLLDNQIKTETAKLGLTDKSLQSVQEELQKALDKAVPSIGEQSQPSLNDLKNLFKKKR